MKNRTYKGEWEGEITIRVKVPYHIYPGCDATRWEPGEPDECEIQDVRIVTQATEYKDGKLIKRDVVLNLSELTHEDIIDACKEDIESLCFEDAAKDCKAIETATAEAKYESMMDEGIIK